jgi:hypothetical protein
MTAASDGALGQRQGVSIIPASGGVGPDPFKGVGQPVGVPASGNGRPVPP